MSREALSIAHARPKSRWKTRAGWTAVLQRINGFRWEGDLITDAGHFAYSWLPDGTAEHAADDIVRALAKNTDSPPPMGEMARD